MNLLSLDPGITTGWAKFWLYGSPRPNTYTSHIRTFTTGNLSDNLLRLRLVDLIEDFKPDVVISERLPVVLSSGMREVQTCVAEVFPQRIEILPGIWKPVTRKFKLPNKEMTQHEKDAYRMGIYFIRFVMKKSNR